jgi:hypothetical protein
MIFKSGFDWEKVCVSRFLLLDLEIAQCRHKVKRNTPEVFCLRGIADVLEDQGGRITDIRFRQV